MVLQAFVYGDSLKAQLVAIIVPDPETLLPWARERNLPQVCAALCACSTSHAAAAREPTAHNMPSLCAARGPAALSHCLGCSPHIVRALHAHPMTAHAQDMPSLCRDKSVIAAVMHSMAEEGRAAQLRGFEAAAAVALVPEPFTVENGLLTPTFKLKRAQAKDAYEALIESLYASLPEGGGGGGGAGGF